MRYEEQSERIFDCLSCAENGCDGSGDINGIDSTGREVYEKCPCPHHEIDAADLAVGNSGGEEDE